jgi:flagellar motor switch protein FliM
MTTDAAPSAMRRKAGFGRPPPEIGQLTPARALQGAVLQAAQDVAELAVTVGKVVEARMTVEKLIASLPEALLLGLVGDDAGRYGLVLLDPQIVAALIEVQTTGRVVPRPAETRAPTRTDAIMCADFIDRMLELLEARAGEAGLQIAPALTGFRYAMALGEPRAIALTLKDVPYRHFTMPLDIAQGAKTGEMLLILPFDPPGRRARGGGEASAFTGALRDRVLRTEAELSATLARREMPLAEIARLTVGTLVALPREALANVAIEDMRGRVVAKGRLGRADGNRAVRITDPDETAAASAAPVIQAPVLAALAFADADPNLDTGGFDPGEVGEPLSLADLPESNSLDYSGDLAGLSA